MSLGAGSRFLSSRHFPSSCKIGERVQEMIFVHILIVYVEL